MNPQKVTKGARGDRQIDGFEVLRLLESIVSVIVRLKVTLGWELTVEIQSCQALKF